MHQVDAKAQLLVRSLPAAGSSSSGGAAEESGDEAEWLDAAASGQLTTEEGSTTAQPNGRAVELQGLSGDSDVLPVPRFVAAEGALHLCKMLEFEFQGSDCLCRLKSAWPQARLQQP